MIADAVPTCVVSTQELEAATECRDELQQAEILIANGSIQEARDRLLALEKVMHSDSQAQFLLGLISLGQKDYADAIVRFRRIVASEPQ